MLLGVFYLLILLFLAKQFCSESVPLAYTCHKQEIKRPVITCNHCGFPAGDSGDKVASMEEEVWLLAFV